MSNLAVCRVCLETDARFYAIAGTPLQEVFEKLTNILLTSIQGKPVVVCYVCHSQLKRCQVLTARALKAEELLTRLLDSATTLTESSVTTLDRQAYNLLNDLKTSTTECITIVEPNATVETADKNNESYGDIVKIEVPKCEKEDTTEGVQEESIEFSDTDAPEPVLSDSEDDVPLKSISMKKHQNKTRGRRKTKWERKEKKGDNGYIPDFAREIILTKEQQLQQLAERAKSRNYLNSPLRCELCYKGFVDMTAYDNHTRKHDEKSGPHECEICHMRYRTERQLRSHGANSHGRQYECNKCAHRSHTANQAREHEKWHKGFMYECKLCGQKFRKPTSYLTHTRKRHPTQHVCSICGDSFIGRHGLLMHRSKAHHSDDKFQPQPNTEEPASERFCSECNIQFHTVNAWKRHILSSYKHILANENSPQCLVCAARFPSAALLAAHVRAHRRALRGPRAQPENHARAADLACDQCGSRFVSRSKLQAHVKRVHLGLRYNRNIVCEVCGKRCTSNAALVYHQRTHTGEKPYQCGACAKRFADSNQLRIHTRVHTGEKPYCCAACGKRFAQKPALNRHYRVHTGAKPYVCQYCTKTFSQSNSLKIHIKTVHLKMPPNRKIKTQQIQDGGAGKEALPTL